MPQAVKHCIDIDNIFRLLQLLAELMYCLACSLWLLCSATGGQFVLVTSVREFACD